MSFHPKTWLVAWWRQASSQLPEFVRRGSYGGDRALYLAIDEKQRDQVLRVGVVGGLFFHLGSLPIDAIVATPRIADFLLPAHLTLTVLLIASLALQAFSMAAFRIVGALTGMAHVVAYTYVLHVSASTEHTLLPEAGAAHVLITGSVMLFMSKPRMALITFLFSIVLAGVTTASIPGSYRWLCTYGVALCLATAIGQCLVRVLVLGLISNYRRLVQAAPPHLAREAVLTGRPFEELCKPCLRSCVCISVGWVDYEMLAAFLPPYVVDAELRLHYRYISELVRAATRTDAIYVDSTVDEIFVVAFETPDLSLDQIWARALGFVELLFEARRRRKPPFAAASLAVGMTRGAAWVGVIGPEAHRKTTGIGELPGRAARLRQVARELGRVRGLRDRLVLDPGDARLGTPAAGFPRVALGADFGVRDLDVNEVAYYEATFNWATDSSVKPGMAAA